RIQARSAAVPLDGMIERDEVFAALEVPFGDERCQQVDTVGEAVCDDGDGVELPFEDRPAVAPLASALYTRVAVAGVVDREKEWRSSHRRHRLELAEPVEELERVGRAPKHREGVDRDGLGVDLFPETPEFSR